MLLSLVEAANRYNTDNLLQHFLWETTANERMVHGSPDGKQSAPTKDRRYTKVKVPNI